MPTSATQSTTPAERERLGGDLAGTVVFSAKEAFYKCWAASTAAAARLRRRRGRAATPTGRSRPAPAGAPSWPGRWAVRDGFVVTAAWAVRRELGRLRSDRVERGAVRPAAPWTTTTTPRPASTHLRRRVAASSRCSSAPLGVAPVERRRRRRRTPSCSASRPPTATVVAGHATEVVLRLSEPVSLTGGSARVLDHAPTVVSGRAGGDGIDASPSRSRRALHDGTYTVAWVAISEDSHPVSGATVFSIGAPSAGAAPSSRRRSPGAGWGVRAGAGVARRRRLRRRARRRRRLVVPRRGRIAMGGRPVAATRPLARRARRGARRRRPGGVDAAAHRPRRRRARRAARQRPAGRVAAGTDRDLHRRHRGRAARAGRVDRAGVGATPAGRRRRALGVGVAALAGFAVEGHTRSQRPVALMVGVRRRAPGRAVRSGSVASPPSSSPSGASRMPASLGRLVARFSAMAVVRRRGRRRRGHRDGDHRAAVARRPRLDGLRAGAADRRSR